MCTCKVGSREEQYNNVYYRLVISGNLLLARKLFQKPVELLVTPLFCLVHHGFIYFNFFFVIYTIVFRYILTEK